MEYASSTITTSVIIHSRKIRISSTMALRMPLIFWGSSGFIQVPVIFSGQIVSSPQEEFIQNIMKMILQ
jgi:predicted transcriptional regulator